MLSPFWHNIWCAPGVCPWPNPFCSQPHRNELLSDFTPVTPAEVSKLLQSMSNKSSQLDYIPTSLVKSCDTFSIIISHLANLSFNQATFPSKFKLALISPLLKKPGLPKFELSNFIPISNLNTIGKNARTSRPGSTFSSYIHISQFLPFAVCLSQIPFDWDRSAQTLERHHGNYWLWKNHYSDCSLTDMSAAFDTPDQATLLHRLQHTFDLSGYYIISWVRSYLTNCTSFVKIDSSSSPNTTICTGVRTPGLCPWPTSFCSLYITCRRCHKSWPLKCQ